MTTPAEIDRVESALLKAAQKVVLQAADQAAGAQNRLSDIANQVMAAADAARTQGEQAVTAAEQAVTDAEAQVAAAAAGAEAQLDAARKLVQDKQAELTRMVEDALTLGNDKLNELKQLAAHPDWFGAVVLALTKIVELSGDQDLAVQIVPAEAPFARGIGLRHVGPGAAPANRAIAVVALAIDGPGTKGLLVSIRGGEPPPIIAGPVTINIRGNGTWRIPIEGPIGDPDGDVSITVDLRQPTGLQPLDGVVVAGAGVVTLHAELAFVGGQPVAWQVRVALEAQPPDHVAGLHVKIDLSQFLGSALSSIIAIDPFDERYSPALVLAKGRAPAFDVNHASG